MAKTVATPEVLAFMQDDPVWQPWRAQGWTLHPGPTPGGRVQAVHETLCLATDGAKRVDTLVGRLEQGKQNYYWFTLFRKMNKR